MPLDGYHQNGALEIDVHSLYGALEVKETS